MADNRTQKCLASSERSVNCWMLVPYRQRRPNRVSAPDTDERRDVRPLSREPHDWGLFNSTYFIIHWKRKAVPDPICRLHGLRRNTQHILWLEITTEWQLRMSITRMRRGIERNSQPKTRRGGLPSTLRGYRSYCGARLDGPSAL